MLTILVMALAVLVWPAEVSKASPMGTAWTYQGRLMDANSPANGLYDLQFKLYDSPSDGNQLASIIDINELDVLDGYLTVLLDFGSDVFIGNACWLEMGVRPGELNDPNAYTTLIPRQQITPTPYALGYLNPLLGLETAFSSATGNTFYGTGAGASNTTGNYNSFLGYYAGNKNTTGSWNTFSGGGAGYWNTTGNSNTFSGRYAGYSNSIGSYNTFLGHQAGYSARSIGNTFLGRYAGYSNITGHDNVFIGHKTGYYETGSNKLYIANSETTVPLIYGDFSTGRVGIGTTNPGSNLEVVRSTDWQNIVKVGYSGTTNRLILSSGSSFAALSGGTTNNDHIVIRHSSGNVGIGTTNPRYRLDVIGDIRATGSVYYGGTAGSNNGTAYNKPDYVFEEGYDIMSVDEVEKYLKKENHLPWMTSAKQEKQENDSAINITRMAFETVETAENLQMQMIELNKIVKEQAALINAQQKRIEALEETAAQSKSLKQRLDILLLYNQ